MSRVDALRDRIVELLAHAETRRAPTRADYLAAVESGAARDGFSEQLSDFIRQHYGAGSLAELSERDLEVALNYAARMRRVASIPPLRPSVVTRIYGDPS